jgi:hypothetical protein
MRTMDVLKNWGWQIALALVALAALAWYALRSGRSRSILPTNAPRAFRAEDWKPRTMRPLTQTELRVLIHLRDALPQCLLMPQVSLARFMQVNQNRSYHQWFSAVGRRCVDFLVCSPQGDVLGVVQLNSVTKSASDGSERKLKTLSLAKIPVWELRATELPSVEALRAMVLPELQAAEQHSQMFPMSPESEWKPTELMPRGKISGPGGKPGIKGVEAVELEDERWNQAWPTEDARPSAYLDDLDMIEVPPIVTKGSSGAAVTGFTR